MLLEIEAKTNMTGVVLAGGESKRFGEAKAFAQYEGKKFFEWAVNAIQDHVDQIMIVSHPTLTNRFRKITSNCVIEDVDKFKGYGPLAGIYSAMTQSQSNWYFILPCDTPLITSTVVKQIISFKKEEYDAIIPIFSGEMQPLVAIYNQHIVEKIEKLLICKKLSMKALIDECNVKFISEKDVSLQGEELLNVNDQIEFKKLFNKDR